MAALKAALLFLVLFHSPGGVAATPAPVPVPNGPAAVLVQVQQGNSTAPGYVKMGTTVTDIIYEIWMYTGLAVLVGTIVYMLAGVGRKLTGQQTSDKEMDPIIFRAPTALYDVATCVTLAHILLAIGELITSIPDIIDFWQDEAQEKKEHVQGWSKRMSDSIDRFNQNWSTFRSNVASIIAAYPPGSDPRLLRTRVSELERSLRRLHAVATRLQQNGLLQPTSDTKPVAQPGSGVWQSTTTHAQVASKVASEDDAVDFEPMLAHFERLSYMWYAVAMMAFVCMLGCLLVIISRVFRSHADKTVDRPDSFYPYVMYLCYTSMSAYTIATVVHLLGQAIMALVNVGVSAYQTTDKHVWGGVRRLGDSVVKITAVAADGLPMLVDHLTDMINASTPVMQSFLLANETISSLTVTADNLTTVANNLEEMDAASKGMNARVDQVTSGFGMAGSPASAPSITSPTLPLRLASYTDDESRELECEQTRPLLVVVFGEMGSFGQRWPNVRRSLQLDRWNECSSYDIVVATDLDKRCDANGGQACQEAAMSAQEYRRSLDQVYGDRLKDVISDPDLDGLQRVTDALEKHDKPEYAYQVAIRADAELTWDTVNLPSVCKDHFGSSIISGDAIRQCDGSARAWDLGFLGCGSRALGTMLTDNRTCTSDWASCRTHGRSVGHAPELRDMTWTTTDEQQSELCPDGQEGKPWGCGHRLCDWTARMQLAGFPPLSTLDPLRLFAKVGTGINRSPS